MEPHKRYLIFEFTQYYPSGGLNDFVDSFDTKEEALSFIKNRGQIYCSYELYDRIEGLEIFI